MAIIRVNKLVFKYPPRIEYGSLQTLEHPKAFGNQLAMFCSIVKGERKWLPDYGLPVLVHQPIPTNEELQAVILANVKAYFPEAQFTVVCSNIEGRLGYKVCEIRYRINNEVGIVEIEL